MGSATARHSLRCCSSAQSSLSRLPPSSFYKCVRPAVVERVGPSQDLSPSQREGLTFRRQGEPQANPGVTHRLRSSPRLSTLENRQFEVSIPGVRLAFPPFLSRCEWSSRAVRTAP